MNTSQDEINSRLRRDVLEYLRTNDVDNSDVIINHLNSGEDLISRAGAKAHFVASAWILRKNRSEALLVNHAKLKKLIQPGGHIDPGEMPFVAAMREAQEEVGISHLTPIWLSIFDIDVHLCPAMPAKGEDEHWHIDIRYAFEVSDDDSVRINTTECTSFIWQAIDEIPDSADPGVIKMCRKTNALNSMKLMYVADLDGKALAWALAKVVRKKSVSDSTPRLLRSFAIHTIQCAVGARIEVPTDLLIDSEK